MTKVSIDNLSLVPDALGLAIDAFYTFPCEESAENLASVAQKYLDEEHITEYETQEILDNVAQYLETF